MKLFSKTTRGYLEFGVNSVHEFKFLYHVSITIAHPWCGSHSTNISVCMMWEARAGI